MSWLIRGLGAFFALIAVYLVLMFGASESGEVVELITQDANGEQFTTRLWVADHDGAMWLRADSGSGWYQPWCSTMRSGPRLCCAAMRHTRS